MLRKFVLVALMAFFPLTSFSSTRELQISEYHNVKDNPQFSQYMLGVASGVAWVNTVSKEQGKPLYCQPSRMSENDVFVITDAGVARILSNDSYKNAPSDKKRLMTVSFAYVLEMIRRYPCK